MGENFGLVAADDKAKAFAMVIPFNKAALAPGGRQQQTAAWAVGGGLCALVLGNARFSLLFGSPEKRDAAAFAIADLVKNLCAAHWAAYRVVECVARIG